MTDSIETTPPDAVLGAEAPDARPVRIGGWLLLPTIGLLYGSTVGTVTWVGAVRLYPEVAARGYGGLYALELGVQLALLLLLIYAATRFFGQKRNAPATFVTLLVAGVVAAGLLCAIELGAGAKVFAIESGKRLALSVVSAAIWIPYFKRSKQVRATFVR